MSSLLLQRKLPKISSGRLLSSDPFTKHYICVITNFGIAENSLIVRFLIGPLCDRFGPRLCFAGILFAGAIPTAMAGLVTNATGLLVLRFFIGILGASFVPCQVWSTGFFDKNVVGSANGLMAGIGNAGGGIT